MKIAIYSRKSIYTGKGESIENQIEMCKKYIFEKISTDEKNNIVIYEDEGFSAKNTLRPQFQKMLNDIKSNDFSHVVCYRLDRISRSVSDFSSLIEDFNKRNISFICIKEEFDTGTPMGKAMMYIASVFAQLERETIAERVRDNMIELAKTGRWLGGTTPTGFICENINEPVNEGKTKSLCVLKFEPSEIEIVKTIFAKYMECHSLSGVSKFLIKENIKSRGGKFFCPQGIKEILQNPVYTVCDEYTFNYFTSNNAVVCFDELDFKDNKGIITYNKRNYQKNRNSIDKWIVAKGSHLGIVSGKEWVLIQNLIIANKPSGKKPSIIHNDYSLLSGMIYCTKCQNRMFAKPRSNSTKLFDYICNSKLKGGITLCDCKNLNGFETDSMVYDYLIKHIEPNGEILKLLAHLKLEITNNLPSNQETIIKDLIARCNSKIDNLIHKISRKELSDIVTARINSQIEELHDETTRLIKKLEVIKNSKQTSNENPLKFDIIAKKLLDMDSLSTVEKQDFIKCFLEKLEWDGVNLKVFYK